MHCQLKQTALPCQLSGEHFRRHYRALCRQRPRADVDGSVGICVRGVAARDAAKGGLIGSVLLVDAPARGALARRVAGINEDHGNASALRLVRDESAQLSETPISQPCALIAAGRYPLANTLEFLKSDSPRGAFSIHHDSLGDAVVRVFLEPRLFSGQLTQSALGTLRAALLQTGSAFLLMAPDTFNISARVDGPVAVDGERNDAEVDAKPILGLEFGRLWDVASRGQIPFAADETEIDLALLKREQAPLMLAHDARNGDATFERPDACGGTVLHKAKDALVIGLCRVGAEDRRDISVDFECIRNFGNRANGHLSGKAETGADVCIGELVKIKLPKDRGIMPDLRKPRRSLVTAGKRRRQRKRLRFRRDQLNCGYQLHAFKYGDGVPRSQEGRALLASAIPLPAKAGSFSRRSL